MTKSWRLAAGIVSLALFTQCSYATDDEKLIEQRQLNSMQELKLQPYTAKTVDSSAPDQETATESSSTPTPYPVPPPAYTPPKTITPAPSPQRAKKSYNIFIPPAPDGTANSNNPGENTKDTDAAEPVPSAGVISYR